MTATIVNGIERNGIAKLHLFFQTSYRYIQPYLLHAISYLLQKYMHMTSTQHIILALFLLSCHILSIATKLNRQQSIPTPSPILITENPTPADYGIISEQPTPVDFGSITEQPTPLEFGSITVQPTPLDFGLISENPTPSDYTLLTEAPTPTAFPKFSPSPTTPPTSIPSLALTSNTIVILTFSFLIIGIAAIILMCLYYFEDGKVEKLSPALSENTPLVDD